MKNTLLAVTVSALLSATIASCNKPAQSKLPLTDRDSFTELTGEQVFNDIDLNFPQSLESAGNTMLIQDGNLPDGNMLMAVDINGKQPIKYFATQGMGPGEFMNTRVVDYNPADTTLYIYDSVLRKARIYKIDPDSFDISPANTVSEYTLKSLTGSDACPGASGLITADAGDGKMFALVNDEGEVLGRFGIYPGDNTGLDTNPLVFSSGHQMLMATNDARNRFVAAGVHSDWLAFYALNGTDAELIEEYFSYESPVEVNVTKVGEMEVMAPKYTDDTRTGFISLMPAPDYLYAVYSGSTKTEREAKTAQPVCIMKFTWDGRFVTGYRLPEPTGARTVSADGKYLYAVTSPDGENYIIKRYPLP